MGFGSSEGGRAAQRSATEITGNGSAPRAVDGVLCWIGPSQGFLGSSQGSGGALCSPRVFFLVGFSYEKDTRLYFDDTCVVPERLEGKNLAPEEAYGGTGAHGGRCGDAGICSACLIKPSSAGTVLLRAAEHHPTWQLGITAMLHLCP